MSEERRHTERIKNRYEQRLKRHDPESPEAVHWSDENKIKLRHRVLTGIDNLGGKKVLDFGCGTGLFLDYLHEEGINCTYHGWDISEAMVNSARERHPEATFKQVDVLTEDVSRYHGEFDYIIISGVFNVKTDSTPAEHKRWVYNILGELWPICSDGISMNFLTEYVDWMDDDLYYCKYDELIEFCENEFDGWFTIRRDYELWEHTLYAYKEPQFTL